MEGKRRCRGWEKQIDKGKGREESILWRKICRQENKASRVYCWLSLLTGRGISVVPDRLHLYVALKANNKNLFSKFTVVTKNFKS